jgi:hypothetical protein
MSAPREPKTWTAAQVKERLRTGKPLHHDDYVIGEGASEGKNGKLERGGWCTTVEAYLEIIRHECVEDGCCTGEDADFINAELERPYEDNGGAHD